MQSCQGVSAYFRRCTQWCWGRQRAECPLRGPLLCHIATKYVGLYTLTTFTTFPCIKMAQKGKKLAKFVFSPFFSILAQSVTISINRKISKSGHCVLSWQGTSLKVSSPNQEDCLSAHSWRMKPGHSEIWSNRWRWKIGRVSRTRVTQVHWIWHSAWLQRT